MKNYSTYIFDFDYTLVDSSKGIIICFRKILDKYGITGISDQQIRNTIGKTMEESLTILTGESDAEALVRLRQEYVAEADIYMNVNTFLFEDTKPLLLELKNRGAKLAIVSIKYRRRINDFLKQHFDDGFIDIVVGGEDVREHKPSPEGVNKILKELDCQSSDALYIGDNPIDSLTAQAAGVDFVGVCSGTTTFQEFEHYPHQMIVERLGQLLL